MPVNYLAQYLVHSWHPINYNNFYTVIIIILHKKDSGIHCSYVLKIPFQTLN